MHTTLYTVAKTTVVLDGVLSKDAKWIPCGRLVQGVAVRQVDSPRLQVVLLRRFR